MIVSHRYASRSQAEIEAREYSHEHGCTVTTYKLPDGRYENVTGYDESRGGEALAQHEAGRQTF